MCVYVMMCELDIFYKTKGHDNVYFMYLSFLKVLWSCEKIVICRMSNISNIINKIVSNYFVCMPKGCFQDG